MYYDLILKLPNLVAVEPQQDKGIFKERFYLYFKQFIDKNNPAKGTFVQRVEFGLNDINGINVFYTSGYALRDSTKLAPNRQNDMELVKHFNANYISPDYRYYGASVPENFDPSDPKSFECLSFDLAADDFHNLYDCFKTVLKGKWIHTGPSKGGLTTNMQAMLYPNDANVYVPYVSVKFFERQYEDFLDNVYFKIGNDIKRNNVSIDIELYRRELNDLQVYLLKNREKYIDKLFEYALSQNFTFTNFALENKKLLYNTLVVDFATGFWQYATGDDMFKTVYDLNHIQDPQEKLNKVLNWWLEASVITEWTSQGSISVSYYVQSYRHEGQYKFKSEPLVKSILKYQKDFKSEQEVYSLLGYSKQELLVLENNLVYKMTLSPEIIEYYKQFDYTFHKEQNHFYEHTNCNMFMIFGTADTWYPLRLNSSNDLTHSPTIREYHQIGQSHLARISTLDDITQNEVWSQIQSVLNEK